MHRRLEFDMRENPASDRRYGSRLALSTKASSQLNGKEDGEVVNSTVFAEQENVSVHAATTPATTVGRERGRGSFGQTFPYEPSSVERPLTCEEAAALIRVHAKTVKRMARSAELPGHFRFGRWFFYASELDSWMRTELHSSRHSCR